MVPDESTSALPIKPSDRIGSLDFLRGLAVLGILIINIESFAYPEPWSPYKYGYHDPLDTSTRFWVYTLFQGKFFSMFTLLFGAGFYLFLERLDQKGMGIKAFDIYARRLLWLFVIGMVHAYLIWDGDVLYHYAICGFLLFPFRSFRLRGLVIVLGILASAVAYQGIVSTQRNIRQLEAYQIAKAKSSEELSEIDRKALALWERRTMRKSADTTTVDLPRKTYGESVTVNAAHTQVHKGVICYQGILFRTLIMMVLGVLLYRLGVFQDYRKLNGYWALTLILLVFAFFVNYHRYFQWTFEYDRPVTNVLWGILFAFPKELMGLAYILVFNGLYQIIIYRSRWKPISGLGRIALTQYLLQSIICGLLFYGYGLGWHNQFTRSELLYIVVAIWIGQLTLGGLYFKYFSQGPVEWLWRQLTYKKDFN